MLFTASLGTASSPLNYYMLFTDLLGLSLAHNMFFIATKWVNILITFFINLSSMPPFYKVSMAH